MRLIFNFDLNIYPAAIVLMPLHHHLKFLVDLRVFGLGARGKIVFNCVGFRALWRHGTLMLLLVERLQVSADRFTWPHRPRALNLHIHVNLTPRRALLILPGLLSQLRSRRKKKGSRSSHRSETTFRKCARRYCA